VINGKKSLRQRSWLLGWVILPYICSTIHTSLDWLYFSKAVDGNELPGGQGLLFSLTHLPVWLEGVGDTFFCLNILLADCSFVSFELGVIFVPSNDLLDMAMLGYLGPQMDRDSSANDGYSYWCW